MYIHVLLVETSSSKKYVLHYVCNSIMIYKSISTSPHNY